MEPFSFCIGGYIYTLTPIPPPTTYPKKKKQFTGGETIRDIQQRSRTECQIDQNFPDHLPRKLTIKGEPENVRLAVDMVKAVINEVWCSCVHVCMCASGYTFG